MQIVDSKYAQTARRAPRERPAAHGRGGGRGGIAARVDRIVQTRGARGRGARGGAGRAGARGARGRGARASSSSSAITSAWPPAAAYGAAARSHAPPLHLHPPRDALPAASGGRAGRGRGAGARGRRQGQGARLVQRERPAAVAVQEERGRGAARGGGAQERGGARRAPVERRDVQRRAPVVRGAQRLEPAPEEKPHHIQRPGTHGDCRGGAGGGERARGTRAGGAGAVGAPWRGHSPARSPPRTSAPASSSTRAHSRCPAPAAKCRGWKPPLVSEELILAALVLAPAFSSISATPACPQAEASWSGVSILRSLACTTGSPPPLISSATTSSCPPRAARCSAVLPWASASMMSAPFSRACATPATSPRPAAWRSALFPIVDGATTPQDQRSGGAAQRGVPQTP
jgi:hypothetical protein